MARNVEIKAYLQEPEALRARLEELTDTSPMLLQEEDVFFNSRKGRLKLTRATDSCALVYYERTDEKEPSESQFMRTEVPDPAELEAILSLALGVRGTVRKERSVYRLGSTRVHLDQVDGLGTFIELQVELAPSQAVAEGRKIATELIEKLGLNRGDLVAESYVDLLDDSD